MIFREMAGGGDEVDLDLRRRAANVIAGGASTGSKRPGALYGPDDEDAPVHYLRASGCRIVTPGGRELVDCTMALGAVALGYADEVVAHAVAEAASNGNVAGLSPALEVELAERLVDLVPCAERVRFLKTGAEGVAAAVRLARAATGRDIVVGCGYFGWLDWASEGPGVPPRSHADVVRVPFDDVAALRSAAEAAGRALAAIVLEPVIERLPSEEWTRAARELCDRLGAVLVFDEVKTGFRLRPAGYQELSGVVPDVAVFAKALANGFPLSAVVGKAAVMDAARQAWVSSTLASETTALAAASAVLDRHARTGVCASLAETGANMRHAVQLAIRSSGIAGVSVDGLDPMWLLRFDDERRQDRFLAIARREGVLFKRGAYDFASLAHDEDTIAAIESAATTAFVELLEEEAHAEA